MTAIYTTNEETDDNPKVLKRNDLDLLNAGNEAINKRLEAQEDDYRDKGLSEDEIRERLAADRLSFRNEFLSDAFPGQDVSPSVFDNLSDNSLNNNVGKADTQTADTTKFNDVVSQGNDIDEQEGVWNKFAAFFNRNSDNANIPSGNKDYSDDVKIAQKMIDDYCSSDLSDVSRPVL